MISPKATALMNRFTAAEIAERCVTAEAEMAGMKLMEAEGDSFAETIVRQNEALNKCDLCDEPAEYRQCQKCMNDKLVGSHTDEEYRELEADNAAQAQTIKAAHYAPLKFLPKLKAL